MRLKFIWQLLSLKVAGRAHSLRWSGGAGHLREVLPMGQPGPGLPLHCPTQPISRGGEARAELPSASDEGHDAWECASRAAKKAGLEARAELLFIKTQETKRPKIAL